ncbi:7-cyano-7-deazaguanine synthase QueC [Candidatus Poribacteria bacterium]|nr:7-cyano-7-deazaguanine synthase QueC [Candidatus Poribacteria bacterium]
MKSQKAIVLLSGGLDSATTLAIAQRENYRVFALSFRYGQRHTLELQYAQKLAKLKSVEKHVLVDIDLRIFGGSALTDDIPVPKKKSVAEIRKEIPVTYVPARNTIFLAFALAWAETLSVRNIFIGVNVLDYSGYPDCRPEYIQAYTEMANLATKAGVEGHRLQIHTPLIGLTKAEIIKTGTDLDVDYALTHSCYCPDNHGRHCGQCDACLLRRKGFEQAKVTDPTLYAI